jgi:hypothetical protein
MNITSPPLKWALPAPQTPTLRWPLAVRLNTDKLRATFSTLRRWALFLLVLLGACTLYDQAIGDGPLPHINTLEGVTKISTSNQINSTHHLPPPVTAKEGWQALKQSRTLLTGLSPGIAEWLYDLKRKNKIAYGKMPATLSFYGKSADTPILAAYEALSGTLYIGNDFWALNNGEKVAILAHEYRHARQNWAKQISVRLAQCMWAGQLSEHSRLENEAFDYERQVRAALGLPPLRATTP